MCPPCVFKFSGNSIVPGRRLDGLKVLTSQPFLREDSYKPRQNSMCDPALQLQRICTGDLVHVFMLSCPSIVTLGSFTVEKTLPRERCFQMDT